MALTDYSEHDGLGLAELIRKRKTSAEEVVKAAIDRIEALNPKINAVTFKAYEEALAAARRPGAAGPFSGVPFLVKDLGADVRGWPHTRGSRYLRDYVSREDGELVTRYRRAGLILLGRTNTPEFGVNVTTEPALFGATRNPWNLDHSAGGSSGGSAAAVAAGIVPLAHANDGGGSIRIPASCCGLFGLKPTRGRVPFGPRHSEMWNGFSIDHVVSRSVRDSAAILDATSAPESGAWYAAPGHGSFLRAAMMPPKRLRIALAPRPIGGFPADDEVMHAARETARLLADLGHIVEEAMPVIDRDRFTGAFGTVVLANTAADIKAFEAELGRPVAAGELEAVASTYVEIAKGVSGADVLLSLREAQLIAREIQAFFTTYDILLTPTLSTPPIPIGHLDTAKVSFPEFMERITPYMQYTAQFNLTGQPAASIPLAWSKTGLPIGVQFVAGFGHEEMLFSLAAQLETARPWATRRPHVFQ